MTPSALRNHVLKYNGSYISKSVLKKNYSEIESKANMHLTFQKIDSYGNLNFFYYKKVFYLEFRFFCFITYLSKLSNHMLNRCI